VVRAFVVGDSYVHGDGVEVEQRFTDLLERRFSGPSAEAQYVNGGLGGSGPLEYARLFRWVGLGYEPTGLLLCVNANDVGDVRPSHSPALVEQRVLPPVGLAARLLHTAWPRLETRLSLARDRAEVAAARRPDTDFTVEGTARRAIEAGIPPQVVEEWRRRIPPAWERAAREKRMPAYLLYWGLFRPDHFTLALDLAGPEAEGLWSIEASLLDTMVETARQRGIAVRAVFLPNSFMYDTGAAVGRQPFALLGGTVRREWALEPTEIQRRLRAWADARAVPLLDLTSVFRLAVRGGEPLYYPIDGHWTAAGHRVAADAIAGWLADDRAFAPPRAPSP
jgi:lysophospholipase L1-like esterase